MRVGQRRLAKCSDLVVLASLFPPTEEHRWKPFEEVLKTLPRRIHSSVRKVDQILMKSMQLNVGKRHNAAGESIMSEPAHFLRRMVPSRPDPHFLDITRPPPTQISPPPWTQIPPPPPKQIPHQPSTQIPPPPPIQIPPVPHVPPLHPPGNPGLLPPGYATNPMPIFTEAAYQVLSHPAQAYDGYAPTVFPTLPPPPHVPTCQEIHDSPVPVQDATCQTDPTCCWCMDMDANGATNASTFHFMDYTSGDPIISRPSTFHFMDYTSGDPIISRPKIELPSDNQIVQGILSILKDPIEPSYDSGVVDCEVWSIGEAEDLRGSRFLSDYANVYPVGSPAPSPCLSPGGSPCPSPAPCLRADEIVEEVNRVENGTCAPESDSQRQDVVAATNGVLEWPRRQSTPVRQASKPKEVVVDQSQLRSWMRLARRQSKRPSDHHNALATVIDALLNVTGGDRRRNPLASTIVATLLQPLKEEWTRLEDYSVTDLYTFVEKPTDKEILFSSAIQRQIEFSQSKVADVIIRARSRLAAAMGLLISRLSWLMNRQVNRAWRKRVKAIMLVCREFVSDF